MNKREPILRQFPRELGYVSEQVVSLKVKRKSSASELTKTINKILKLISEKADFGKLLKYENHLNELIGTIRQVTTEIVGITENDESEVN